ncbi:uncharacterized protein G2W53_013715 [Senna tora]|uniref:Uncharacterized protein n=1 Tax=Senna tora TaxID=362788 RepID=A0A834WQZ0_9FABA|nr:uncharacterized protein G2W53_013715 [Senna tora]
MDPHDDAELLIAFAFASASASTTQHNEWTLIDSTHISRNVLIHPKLHTNSMWEILFNIAIKSHQFRNPQAHNKTHCFFIQTYGRHINSSMDDSRTDLTLSPISKALTLCHLANTGSSSPSFVDAHSPPHRCVGRMQGIDPLDPFLRSVQPPVELHRERPLLGFEVEGLRKWAVLRIGLLSPTGETMNSSLDSIMSESNITESLCIMKRKRQSSEAGKERKLCSAPNITNTTQNAITNFTPEPARVREPHARAQRVSGEKQFLFWSVEMEDGRGRVSGRMEDARGSDGVTWRSGIPKISLVLQLTSNFATD